MYQAYFNNKFTNSLVYYVSLLLLLLISPFLFIWELITTLRSCFHPIENMSGKVVLITGASSGLGELMAYEYAKRGACLAIVAIKEPDSRLEKVAERARELGSPDVLFIFADVSKVDECRMFVDDTIKRFGRLDHLVCNAGIANLYSVNIDITKFAPVMDINFWGSLYTTHFAMPHVMRSSGKIVVNASCAGILNPPKGGFYNTSKAALISFYESLRFEVSPRVTIVILTLGFIETNIITAKYLGKGVGVALRKDFNSLLPTMGAEPCAIAIVDGVCKGATSITEPRFVKVLFLVKFLFPELHQFYLSKFYRSKSKKNKKG
ncbi:11-beta-hydroxysteroid dehydrogenase-like 4A [Lactuca sativa]|uniref:11-beta-hydroxysteroid dehydrogenase-like 4A n=1 Tax=Lactuca sativa TaxID=4236 RepID=UPI000CAE828F|nr:11-beta-hydroxysteroid dehydrogenase-like 4A [Lactuca sativa]